MQRAAAARLQRRFPGHARHARQRGKLLNVFVGWKRRTRHHGVDCAAELAPGWYSDQRYERSRYRTVRRGCVAIAASCWHVDRLGVAIRQVPLPPISFLFQIPFVSCPHTFVPRITSRLQPPASCLTRAANQTNIRFSLAPQCSPSSPFPRAASASMT